MLAILNFTVGYEVEDHLTEDWCFQVKKDGKEIYRITIALKQEDSTQKTR